MQSQTSNFPQLKPKTQKHVIWPYLAVLFWIAVAGFALLEQNNIYDWWRLRNYTPPARMVALASEDTMTSYAKTLLDVNHPVILSNTNFNFQCPNDGGEKTIVLGCYHSGETGIYLLQVTNDPRLNGVEQVTAAHEMLHAAYARLSTSERNKVDAMLLNYYNHDLTDPRIIATIAEYRKTEPTAVVNEMHSVFGTEIMNLPQPLENYYKKYFTDRQAVASYAAQYQSEFTSRQNEVTSDDAQLSNQKTQINNLESTINTEYTQLQTDEKQLNSLSAGDNVSGYNEAVDSYNSEVDQYNGQVGELRTMISNYNALVSSRNSAALIENQLYSELSGSQTSTVQTK
jgi:hypothetical protein